MKANENKIERAGGIGRLDNVVKVKERDREKNEEQGENVRNNRRRRRKKGLEEWNFKSFYSIYNSIYRVISSRRPSFAIGVVTSFIHTM